MPPTAVTFAELVEGIPQVLGCVKGPDGRYWWVNSGFAERLGRRPSDVVGRTVDELFPLEFARSYAAQDARVLATGRPLQRHLELIVRADGRDRLVRDVQVAAPRPSEDRPWGVAVLSIDLHAQLESGHSGLAAALEPRCAPTSGARGASPSWPRSPGCRVKQLERLARPHPGAQSAAARAAAAPGARGAGDRLDGRDPRRDRGGVRLLRPELVHQAVPIGAGRDAGRLPTASRAG